MIDFPANPTTNQIFTSGGVQWIWDGTKWVANGVGTGYVPLSGGTMTGPLILNADPTVALGAATKQQADARTPGENRIINGDMRIDQRNNGALVTVGGYCADRWVWNASQTGKGGTQRVTSNNPGFPYQLQIVSTTAYTLVAADYFGISQMIEADMVSDFAWGTANAQPVTLSFWAYASIIGTYSGSIQNGAASRSFPFTYSITTANTWTRIIIPIFGDPNGTWTLSGNGAGVYVFFSSGMGSTRITATLNAWQSGNFLSGPGAVNLMGTNGAAMGFTGVKLEIGSIASRFVRKSTAEALADCQRYYQILQSTLVTGYQTAGGQIYTGGTFQTAMRANPTVVFSGISYSNAGNLINGSVSPFNFYNAISIIATGQGYALHNVAFSAEL
jgi:hypothetical protein